MTMAGSFGFDIKFREVDGESELTGIRCGERFGYEQNVWNNYWFAGE
jgi:hypothetical protein